MGRSLLSMRSTASISYLILRRRAPCHAFGGRLEGCATGSDDFLATLLERGDDHQDAAAADDEGGHPEKRLAAAAPRHVGWSVEAFARHGTRPRVDRHAHRPGLQPFPAGDGGAWRDPP